jgi:hypothetical protein
MKQFILSVLLMTLLACQRDTSSHIQPSFEATVQGIGKDCYLPLLDFGDRTNEVAQAVGTPSAYRLYYAVNLPATYWKTGLSLTTTIRQPTRQEQVACTTMGPGYPVVVVVSAEGK